MQLALPESGGATVGSLNHAEPRVRLPAGASKKQRGQSPQETPPALIRHVQQ